MKWIWIVLRSLMVTFVMGAALLALPSSARAAPSLEQRVGDVLVDDNDEPDVIARCRAAEAAWGTTAVREELRRALSWGSYAAALCLEEHLGDGDPAIVDGFLRSLRFLDSGHGRVVEALSRHPRWLPRYLAVLSKEGDEAEQRGAAEAIATMKLREATPELRRIIDSTPPTTSRIHWLITAVASSPGGESVVVNALMRAPRDRRTQLAESALDALEQRGTPSSRSAIARMIDTPHAAEAKAALAAIEKRAQRLIRAAQ